MSHHNGFFHRMATGTAAVAVTLSVLAGCASKGTTYQSSGADVSQLLTTIDTSAYGDPESCISTYDYDSVDVLSDKVLLFHDGRKDFWINTLRSPCTHLTSYDSMAFDLHGPRVCSLDTVTPVDWFLGWQRFHGPGCSLGEFQRVSEPQAAMIREALE